MLGSSIKTPSNPVPDTVLKDSIDKYTKTGRQVSPLGVTDGNRFAQRHLSARWYGSPLLLVCTGELEPETGPLRSSVPHKTFTRLQTAHHRLSDCRIICSWPSGRAREIHEAGWHPSLFLSVFGCLVGDPYGGKWRPGRCGIGVRKVAAKAARD